LNRYQQLYPGAKPLPITSWQIWNEPNLRKFFDPGGTDAQLAPKYGELLKISHEAIRSEDPNAQIILAGSPGYPPSGGPRAWEFLNQLYNSTPHVKNYFEVAALHPYAQNVANVRVEIQKFRDVMVSHGDRATPLWITEIGWGSDPPDQFGINQGPVGQQQRLSGTYKMILDNRTAWNLQRVYWFLWRDPDPNSPFAHRCSFCASAGLLRFNRTRKPAYNAFVGFTADATPPSAYFASGPAANSTINDPTPTFTFGSTDPGSSFQCRIDGAPFKTCTTTYTTPHLSDGPHKISVEAIDAPGNVSAIKGRPFTVDTTPPAVTITSGPANGSATQSRYATFGFATDDSNAAISCQLDTGGFSPCSSPFTNPDPLNDGVHTFQVRARDQAGNVGGAGRLWSVDNVPPTVTITSATPDQTDPRPSFSFAADESGVTYKCHFDADAPTGCSSPYAPANRLSNAQHTFEVVATDRAGNTGAPATMTWTVNAPPVDVRIDGGPAPGSVVNDPTPRFRFSSSDAAANFKCRVGGSAAPWSDCGSGGSGAFTTSHLRDGHHLFAVMALDGPDSQTASRSFTVDTTAPTTTISSGPANGAASSDPSPSFSFHANEVGSRFQCRLGSHPFANCSSPHSIGPLADGSHEFRVRAIDSVGNAGAASSRSFRIDTKAPRLRIRGPDRVVTRKATATATFVLRASERVSRRCRVGSKGFVRCSQRYRTPRLGGGAHTLKVQATDRAGNVTTERKRFRIVEKRAGKRHRRRHR
jgi:Glycosyl hydrolase catalytic core